MHTVELLELAILLAERLGYRVRLEWLGGSGGGSGGGSAGGSGGGACEFAGQRWIFVDLALTAIEQLEQVLEPLYDDPALLMIPMHPDLRRVLQRRRAA